MTASTLSRKLARYRVMETHRRLVRNGNHDAARLILALLRKGTVKLGLGDAAFLAEIALCDAGLEPYYAPNGNYARFRL